MLDLCKALDVVPKTFYRWRKPKVKKIKQPSFRKLTKAERKQVLELLTSEKFIDMTVSATYYTLLDRGEYFCSISTMYAILKAEKAVKERREQRKHPEYKKPTLVATKINQVWSWDITKLPTLQKGVYFNLYSIIDLFDRYTVGWLISEKENATLAKELIEQTCQKQNIKPRELTIHSDRGSPMTSKTMATLFIDLGVIKSFSRPRVSNDNPFSEALFKTLKYHRTFPKKFGSIQDARNYMTQFFDWYNNEHYHSGIAMLTPATLRENKTDAVLLKRQQTLEKAYAKNQERFVKGSPKPKKPPKETWINNPNKNNLTLTA